MNPDEKRPRLSRRQLLWSLVALSVLVNVVAVGGVIALVTSSTAAGSIGPRLHLATAHQVQSAQGAADAAASAADDAASTASDVESRVSDLESASGTSDLQASVDDLESRVSDLEGGSGSSDLQSTVDDLDSRVSDLEDQVFSACDAIDTLSMNLQEAAGVYATC